MVVVEEVPTNPSLTGVVWWCGQTVFCSVIKVEITEYSHLHLQPHSIHCKCPSSPFRSPQCNDSEVNDIFVSLH